jgi:hypothetical protein
MNHPTKGHTRTLRGVLPTHEGQSTPRELPLNGAELIDGLNDVGIRFLMTDLDVALSFLNMALWASDEEHKERFCRHARRAHDAVLHLLPRLNCSQVQRAEIDAKLSRVHGGLKNCNGSEGRGLS